MCLSKRLLAGLLLAFVCAVPVRAETCGSTESPTDVLNVGISDSPPFVILEEGAPPSGLSVELWRRVELDLLAEGLIKGSEFIRCDAIDDLSAALERGALDIVLSPLTVTPERLDIHKMSRQYFLSGLTVATRFSGEIEFGHALDVLVSTLFRPGTMRIIMLFLLFNLLLAVLIRWLVVDAQGRQRDQGAVRGGAILGYIDPYLDAIERTLGLKGISEARYNFAGRLLEIFMAIIGALLSAGLLGVLTTAFVSALGQTRPPDAEDLLGLRVGVVADSTAEAFLVSSDINSTVAGDLCQPLHEADTKTPGCRTTDTITQLVKPLARGQIDVVLGDWAELTYLTRVRFSDGKIKVEDAVYHTEPLAWGFGKGMSKLSHKIDRSLVKHVRASGWRNLVPQYLGSGKTSPD